MKKSGKIIKRILLSLVAVVLLAVGGFLAMFNKEISTINSIKKIDDYGLYLMDYKGDYGFDAFLDQGGVSTDNELIGFVTQRLLKGLPVKFNIPDFGCSTFLAQTTTGDWIFGRNYDLDNIPSMIVTTHPDNGYASISVVNLSVLGYTQQKGPDSFMSSVISLAAPYAPMDGMNEMGVSIGVLLIKEEATNQISDKLDITTSTAIRLVLDKAANVEEAIALLENADMHASANSSYHFQIADASGNSVVIEYIDNKIRVIRKESDENQALTNFLISEERYGSGKGQDRYEVLMNTLNQKQGILSEQEAMDLLQAVSQDKINEAGGVTATQWSVVYNNTQKTMMICAGNQFDQVYTFTLE